MMNNKIQFPYKNCITNIDLCLLLVLVAQKFSNTKIIGIDCSDLNKISPKQAFQRLEEITKSQSWLVKKEDGTFCILEFSEMYLILMCILNPDAIVDFSNCSFKESKENLVLYVKKFKGAKIFLSVYQNPKQNLVKYQLDCKGSQSAGFLMHFMKQQYIPRSELEDKLYQLFEPFPDVQEWVEEGVICFISMQIIVPNTENKLFYLIEFENNISGIFEYDIKKNCFLHNKITSEYTENSELLGEWIKMRFEE